MCKISEQLRADPCYARDAPGLVGPRPPEPLTNIAKMRRGVVTTSTLYYFVDTNLFIQCHPLQQLDWSPWQGFEEVRLIVSSPVQHEIDRLKTRGGRIGKRARVPHRPCFGRCSARPTSSSTPNPRASFCPWSLDTRPPRTLQGA